MSEKVSISAMPTPNPQAIKFLPSMNVFEGSGALDFPDAEKAKGNALPEQLFEIDGVDGVMVGSRFVTVTKNPDSTWENLLEPVRDLIVSILESAEPVISEASKASLEKVAESQSEVEKQIIDLLDAEIRPAIALDGGDLEFKSLEDGIVTVQLQGACSGCPASTMTLKMGIESRLKEAFPGVVEEVVQVQ